MKRLSTLAIGLVLLEGGCGVVANLGDPKQLGPMDDDGGATDTGVESDSQSPRDGSGDIGNGDASTGSVPQAVAIAVGSTHACAVIKNGPSSPDNDTVRCWGSNASGELGSDPAKVPSSSRPLAVTPRPGIPPNKASSLTLAAGYSCATTTDQYLLCWGDVPGGSSITREQSSPAYEPSLMDLNVSPLQISSASMGPEGGCCTQFDGSLVCWGGDLAPAAPDGGVLLDGGVFVGDAFESVAVGTAHACGIGVAGSTNMRDVECWGADDRGQAGMPFSGLVDHPHHLGLVQSGDPLIQVAAGGDVSCALFSSGALYCWGADDRGQLGMGSTADSYQPVRVTLPEKALAVTVGDAHVCAVLADYSVWCWGDNTAGQLGAGPGGAMLSATPTRVLTAPGHDLPPVQRIAAGGGTTCALPFGYPDAWCWGDNSDGQAGQPSGGTVPYATAVAW